MSANRSAATALTPRQAYIGHFGRLAIWLGHVLQDAGCWLSMWGWSR